MLTIVSMPQKIKSFFHPLAQEFTGPAWAHFWRLVLALCICHGATIERLTRAMRSPVHRTKHGEFLWKSHWDSSWVIQAIALDTLKRLRRKNGGPCYFVIDETQTLKRAKKMAGVGMDINTPRLTTAQAIRQATNAQLVEILGIALEFYPPRRQRRPVRPPAPPDPDPNSHFYPDPNSDPN